MRYFISDFALATSPLFVYTVELEKTLTKPYILYRDPMRLGWIAESETPPRNLLLYGLVWEEVREL